MSSPLDPDGTSRLFHRQVRPLVFDGYRPSASPRLVLVGAQPGAGKSYVVAHAMREAPDLVPLSGDALRPFHPDYVRLLCADPFAMPNATGPAVAAWVRACIDHALSERFSLLLEGTFREPQVVAATIRRFAAAGYRTEVVVLAVRPERSRLDSLLRYLSAGRLGRWTPPTAHDTAFARLPDAVRGLQDVDELHRIVVRTRDRVVLADERGPSGRWQLATRACDVLKAEHSRPFSVDEAREWLNQYEHAIATAEERSSIDRRSMPTYRALIEDADRISAMASGELDDPTYGRFAVVQSRAWAMLLPHDPLLAIGSPPPAAGRAFPHPDRLDAMAAPPPRPESPPTAPRSDRGQHR